MNNQESREAEIERERRMLPFFVEFVKFSIGFSVIVAIALLALNAASAAIR